MAVEYSWPTKEKSHAIGKRVKRAGRHGQSHRRGQIHLRRQPEKPAHRQGPRLPARALHDQVDRRGAGAEGCRRRVAERSMHAGKR